MAKDNKKVETREVPGTVIIGGKSGSEGMQHRNPMAATNKITPESSKEVVKELRKQGRVMHGGTSVGAYKF